MCRICDGEGCLNCDPDPDRVGDMSCLEEEQDARDAAVAYKTYIDARQATINIVSGLRATCFAANHKWGECTCNHLEVPEDEGFEHNGTWITDPRVSECGRFFVEPSVYYGATYVAWLSKRMNKVV